MSSNKQKLELTWIGKENPEYAISNIEPRILEEKNDLSFGDTNTENMLIHGDNLLALKALLPEFEGRIKCVYIDPPYNTGNAFEQYDDSVEHSTWLSLVRPRLELIKALLSEEGSLWISIDDDECHYLKVLCDEIFGRENFVSNVIWEKKYSPSNDAKWLSDSHDHILVYAKRKETWRPNLLPRGEKQNVYYKYDDNDGRGPWRSDNVLVKSFSQSGVFPIINPNTGQEFYPPKGSCFRFNAETAKRYLAENRFYFGKAGTGAPQLKRFLSEVKDGVTVKTIWIRDDVGDNQEAKKEVKEFGETIFATPKPERLIERILFLATKESDIVLDSFLGSGTTAAVAHKMNRRWIGVELGDHAYTHCKVRLEKVVDGSDQGGISKNVNWQGGGGFKFYELAPSFVVIDEFGNPVIDGYYNDIKLIRAMCKLTNYTFSPSQTDYWKHGKGQGNNSIYVTTQLLTVAIVQQIANHLGKNETLLICPKKFEPGCEKVDTRITIKKIPQSILKSCQFGKKEYLLPIKEKPIEEYDEEDFEQD